MRNALFLSLIYCYSAIAVEGSRYDKSRLFVKSNSIESLKTLENVSRVQHLFANNYVISTRNYGRLLTELKQAKIRFEKNIIADKQALTVEIPEVIKENIALSFEPQFFNDPMVEKIWSFRSSNENGVSVNDYYFAPLSREKQPLTVAVVDTGVEYTHDDIQDNMWINSKEIPLNNIDDDQNGYIDDYHGINTLVRDEEGNATGNPMPTHYHGTHVAGTIAATQNNNLGIAGIASSAKIMAIRTVPNRSDETDVDIVESFLYAAKNGARIINCSFGKKNNEGGTIVNETIDYIGKTYGTLVFASAGNEYGRDIDEEPKYPASFPSEYLVVVTSTSDYGNLSSFSNIGARNVDLAAPGSRIYSTVLNQEYSYKSGTSMATPTAVGVAAELWSIFPELSAMQIKEVLIKSSIPNEGLKRKLQAEGIVDLQSAVRYTLENYSSL